MIQFSYNYHGSMITKLERTEFIVLFRNDQLHYIFIFKEKNVSKKLQIPCFIHRRQLESESLRVPVWTRTGREGWLILIKSPVQFVIPSTIVSFPWQSEDFCMRVHAPQPMWKGVYCHRKKHLQHRDHVAVLMTHLELDQYL